MEFDNRFDVEARLGQLAPEADWHPNVDAALVRFGEGRNRRTAERRALLALAALLFCAGVAGVEELHKVSAADRVLRDRQAAPAFTLKDVSGNVIQLSNYRHKVVLLNFWATWCHGCKMEIPCFMDFQNKYKDQGFTVIGVSMDEDGFRSVAPFLEEEKLNYPVVIGNAKLARDYGVESMPETLLIDGSGRIAAFHLGLVDRPSLEREIRALLH